MAFLLPAAVLRGPLPEKYGTTSPLFQDSGGREEEEASLGNQAWGAHPNLSSFLSLHLLRLVPSSQQAIPCPQAAAPAVFPGHPCNACSPPSALITQVGASWHLRKGPSHLSWCYVCVCLLCTETSCVAGAISVSSHGPGTHAVPGTGWAQHVPCPDVQRRARFCRFESSAREANGRRCAPPGRRL